MKPKASIPLVVLLIAIEANGSQDAFETRSTRLRSGNAPSAEADIGGEMLLTPGKANDEDGMFIRGDDGRVYFAWISDRAWLGRTGMDVWMKSSPDGLMWSRPWKAVQTEAEDLMSTLVRTSDGRYHLTGQIFQFPGGDLGYSTWDATSFDLKSWTKPQRWTPSSYWAGGALQEDSRGNYWLINSTHQTGYSGRLDLASQVGAASSAARLSGVRPNLVVIMADDLDVHSLDVLIARGLMPNLKRHIIDRGVTFNQSFVTNSLCCPSRATFLTGQYSHNNSVLTNTPGTSGSVTALRDNLTLATWLQGAGYRTGHVGKYLNMYGTGRPPYDHPALDPTYVPPGWDDWQGLVDSTTYQVYGYTINDNGNLMTYGSQEEHPEHYQTDVLADRAVSFIQESNSLGDAQPFFLMVAPLAPHVEVDLGEPESIARWGKTIRPDPQDQFDKPLAWSTLQNLQLLPAQKASFNELDVSDKPRWLRQKNMLDATDITELTRQYRDRLTTLLSIDDLIDKVVTTLESAGELDNTLIVFTSDNGWLYGEHRLSSKMVAYEESIRVPTYVRTPWVPGRTSVDEAALNNDWAPTFLELAGANSGSLVVDGRSLVPLLQGTTPAVWRKRFLVEHWPNVALFDIPKFSAVRTLVSDTTDPLMLYVECRNNSGLILGKELYDLKVDPLELLSLDSVFQLRFQRQRLSAHLAALVTCSGLRCQNFEN